MQQQLFIKEFGPEIRHIKGTDNVAADTLSRNDYDTQEHLLLSDASIKEISREMYASEAIVVPVN